MGGGGAMILAHGFLLSTSDIDAIQRGGISPDFLDPFVKEIAKKLGIPHDWLNPYFSTYSHTLPPDYAVRLVEVFSGKRLKVLALGKEEMLIMKCFAHRRKDVGHARALVRGKANIDFVEKRIEELHQKKIPGTQAALDFLHGRSSGAEVDRTKRLSSLPSHLDLERAYRRLQSKAPYLDSELPMFLEYAEWVRMDPRLGEIWLSKFKISWRTFSVLGFNDIVRKLTWPAVVGVLLEQFHTYEIVAEERLMFSHWKKIAMYGVDVVPYQIFFIGLSPLVSKSVDEASVAPLKSFSVWGFYGREVFLNKSQTRKPHRIEVSRESREQILNSLLDQKPRIQMKDYLEALGRPIPRRTAELDLKRCRRLRPYGATKARMYLRKGR